MKFIKTFAPRRDDRGPLYQALAGGALVVFLGPRIHAADPEVFGPIHVLLLVAVVVVSPLAFALVEPPAADSPLPAPGARLPLVVRLAARVLPIAGATTAASFLFPPGRTAALLAAPWAVFALLAAASGVLRFVRRRGARLHLPELCVDAGLVYLPFAARWLLTSRAGVQVPRVPEPILVLTAVHFHYTFFAATVLTGLLGRGLARVESPLTKRVYSAAAIGVLAGPLLVATGINTTLPAMEVTGAVLLAASLFTTAVLTAFVAAPREPADAARWLLSMASLALGAGMVLAAHFGIGKFRWVPTWSIQEMIRLHGVTNATFTVLALLGWHVARQARESAPR